MEKLWEFSVNAKSFELKDIEAALSEIQVNPLIILIQGGRSCAEAQRAFAEKFGLKQKF